MPSRNPQQTSLCDLIEPFSIMHEGDLYRVAFDHREGDKDFLNVQHILDGTEEVVLIMNYAKGSGNEHLVGTLHYKATAAFCDAMVEMVTAKIGALI